LIDLKDITLVAIVGSENMLDNTKLAFDHCMSQANFGDCQFLSCKDNIPYMNTAMYNEFCIKELTNYVNTDFCLVIQWDGYIIDTDYWTNEFLEYDYIGSPWAGWNFAIGNGGFSLRSKKFLDVCSKLNYDSKAHFKAGFDEKTFISDRGFTTPEDWFICIYKNEFMVENNIKFPSPELAYQFAVEHQGPPIKTFDREDITTYKSFGFHGNFNKAGMEVLYK
jgi:hypothetical protein